MRPQSHGSRRLCCTLLAGFFAVALVVGNPSPALLAQSAAKAKLTPANHATGDGYVGTAACSRCHLEIANSYARASMGHSLVPITPEFLKALPINVTQPGAYIDQKTGHRFEVHAEDGKLYQTEIEMDDAGHEVFRDSRQMEWMVGAGENGFGAVLSRDGYLFQAPLSFYTKPGKWDFSPGYEHDNLGFRRFLIPGCLYCHSGRPQPIAGEEGKYAAQPFRQISVGCENCHGPGAAHVAARREGEDTGKKADPTIVNPARLTEQRSDDICMSCHQFGDARVLQPGKTFQDFRPGQPLERTVSILQVPPTRDNPPQDDHVDHFYSMSLSKCFRASVGGPPEKQMRCITCHDPHVEPTRAEAPAYFNGKCLTCHTAQSCTAPQAQRQQTTPADNCIGCHMPKRDIAIISHSSATNHRIVTSLEEPFPEETFNQTTAAVPDLLQLDPAGARGPTATPPSRLTRLQAYAALMPANPQYEASWRKVLAELESTTPNNAVVQAALGHRDLEDQKPAAAIPHLRESLRLDPAQAEVYEDLSEAQAETGKAEEAVASARRAAELAPFLPQKQRTYIGRLIDAKHYPEAQAAMEKYLLVFPADDFMRKMLTMAKTP